MNKLVCNLMAMLAAKSSARCYKGCREVGKQERKVRTLTAAGHAGGDDLVSTHGCQLGEGI